MIVRTFATASEAAQAAAAHTAGLLRSLKAPRITAATGTSQLEFLKHLIGEPGIDWHRAELFHLDEFIGLPATHAASFQRYIRERLAEPAGIANVHYLDGMADPAVVCAQAGAAISRAPIDITFAGVGENGHLAFNDPPADFETEESFLIVTLDQRARQQQVSEGWFARLDEVPTRAITMSVRQILKSRHIVCIATGERKAEAIRLCLAGEISPQAPASALRLHASATLFLDREAAALTQPINPII